jgi:hypothetical protein
MRIFPPVSLEWIIGIVLGGLLMFALAVLFVGLGIYQRRRVGASQAWPSTLGKIVSSKLVEGSSSDGGRTISAEVVYSYTVAGQEYRSDHRDFGGGGSGSLAGGNAIIARYPAGSNVTVYYNPATPGDAVIERRSSIAGLMYALCAMFVLFGCGMAGCAGLLAANNYYLANRGPYRARSIKQIQGPEGPCIFVSATAGYLEIHAGGSGSGRDAVIGIRFSVAMPVHAQRSAVDQRGGIRIERRQLGVGLGLGDLARGHCGRQLCNQGGAGRRDHIVGRLAIVGRDLGQALAGLELGYDFLRSQAGDAGRRADEPFSPAAMAPAKAGAEAMAKAKRGAVN